MNYKRDFPVWISIAVYLAWLFLAVGFRMDHLYFILFFLVCYYLSPLSRSIILSFIFFLLFWIIYDSMRVYPNYLINPVHIAEPYELEKALFGIQDGSGGILTPNEYFNTYPNKLSDLLSGIFYLTWVPLPFAYGIWLYFKDRKMLLNFSLTFLICNLIGFIIYYAYPAAPPWYKIVYGTQELFNIPGEAANLKRFDSLVGSPIFENMYKQNANVFAAIPSLHAAYPIVTFFFVMKKRYRLASILFFLDIVGIWFAAVYSLHHYIIDLILGGFCAIIAIFAFELLNRTTIYHRYINLYSEYTKRNN